MKRNRWSAGRTLHGAIAPIWSAAGIAAGLLLWAILLLRRRSRDAWLADLEEELK